MGSAFFLPLPRRGGGGSFVPTFVGGVCFCLGGILGISVRVMVFTVLFVVYVVSKSVLWGYFELSVCMKGFLARGIE